MCNPVKLITYFSNVRFFDHFIEILVHNTNKRIYFKHHKGIQAGENLIE
jgi:hypothetical protein